MIKTILRNVIFFGSAALVGVGAGWVFGYLLALTLR